MKAQRELSAFSKYCGNFIIRVVTLYLKGKTQAAPEVAVQVAGVMVSRGQAEVWVLAQSPQLLVTTVPLESTLVAHQGVGELA